MKWICVRCSIILSVALSAGALYCQETQALPNTGQTITPMAPRGARYEPLNPGLADFPEYNAGQAATTVVSPDKKTLLILTSGYNRLNNTTTGQRITADSNEYIFVYDISATVPLKKQVLQVPNAYYGIAMDPSGTTFYAAGGVSDDIHIFDLKAGTGQSAPAVRSLSAIRRALGMASRQRRRGLRFRATAKNWWSPTTTTIRSAF
jgi:hypothetical protein